GRRPRQPAWRHCRVTADRICRYVRKNPAAAVRHDHDLPGHGARPDLPAERPDAGAAPLGHGLTVASRTFVRRSFGVALALAALVAQAVSSFFAQELIAEAAILAIFALSLDFLATCGLISFGHAGLLGVGCYVFAGMTVLMGGSPNLAFPLAVVAGACVAFTVGLFVVRTTG